MSKTPVLSVPARGDQLAVISDFVNAAAREAGLSERSAYHVQTAVDEACANIIYHAYDFEGQGTIEVCCESRRDDFIVTITDHGRPFDPAAVPEPDVTAALDARNEGGLGRFLMRKLMDGVQHDFTREGNVLTMLKHVKRR
jgi:serine/threonine-protein kinase RsbW